MFTVRKTSSHQEAPTREFECQRTENQIGHEHEPVLVGPVCQMKWRAIGLVQIPRADLKGNATQILVSVTECLVNLPDKKLTPVELNGRWLHEHDDPGTDYRVA